MTIVSRENNSSVLAFSSSSTSSTSSRATSTAPLAINPQPMLPGQSSPARRGASIDPASLAPTARPMTTPMVVGGRWRKEAFRCSPADAKNSGTKNPSAALRSPGSTSNLSL